MHDRRACHIVKNTVNQFAPPFFRQREIVVDCIPALLYVLTRIGNFTGSGGVCGLVLKHFGDSTACPFFIVSIAAGTPPVLQNSRQPFHGFSSGAPRLPAEDLPQCAERHI